MPVLRAEPNLFPENLFADFCLEQPTGCPAAWWVLHTLPRQEKALARNLFRHEIPFYLPLIARRNLIRGRAVDSSIPLFTSYVFLLGTDRERIAALTSNRGQRTAFLVDRLAGLTAEERDVLVKAVTVLARVNDDPDEP